MTAATTSELPNRERRTLVRSNDFSPTYRLQPVVVQFRLVRTSDGSGFELRISLTSRAHAAKSPRIFFRLDFVASVMQLARKNRLDPDARGVGGDTRRRNCPLLTHRQRSCLLQKSEERSTLTICHTGRASVRPLQSNVGRLASN